MLYEAFVSSDLVDSSFVKNIMVPSLYSCIVFGKKIDDVLRSYEHPNMVVCTFFEVCYAQYFMSVFLEFGHLRPLKANHFK